jgi:hypothetical protein
MASDDTASHLAICLVNGEMGLLHSAGEAYATQPTASDVKVKAERGSAARFAQSAAYAARSTESEAGCGLSKLTRSIGPSHLRYDSHYYIAHYRFSLTFRGADFSHSVVMRRERIAKSDSQLRSRKVTKNHIIESDSYSADV